MKTQTPVVVETDRIMYLLASDAKTNNCTGAYLTLPSSSAISLEVKLHMMCTKYPNVHRGDRHWWKCTGTASVVLNGEKVVVPIYYDGDDRHPSYGNMYLAALKATSAFKKLGYNLAMEDPANIEDKSWVWTAFFGQEAGEKLL